MQIPLPNIRTLQRRMQHVKLEPGGKNVIDAKCLEKNPFHMYQAEAYGTKTSGKQGFYF